MAKKTSASTAKKKTKKASAKKTAATKKASKKSTTKKMTKKKAAAKKKTAAKKSSVKKKKTTAKKTAAKKKGAVKKKTSAKKKAAPKKKKATSKKKSSTKKKTTSRKKTSAKKKASSKKTAVATAKAVAVDELHVTIPEVPSIPDMTFHVASADTQSSKEVARGPISVKPSLTIVEEDIIQPKKDLEVHRKMMVVNTCENCDHMPMRANHLVAVLGAAIVVLSGMLVYSSSPDIVSIPFSFLERLI